MPSQSTQEQTSPSSPKNQEPYQHSHQKKHSPNLTSTKISSTSASHTKPTLPKILITGSPLSDKNATPPSSPPLDHQTGKSQADQENAQDSRSSTPKLRIAVIGSGLAGLTAAHLLSSLHTENGRGERGIDVHLFEKAHKLGKVQWITSVTAEGLLNGRIHAMPDVYAEVICRSLVYAFIKNTFTLLYACMLHEP